MLLSNQEIKAQLLAPSTGASLLESIDVLMFFFLSTFDFFPCIEGRMTMFADACRLKVRVGVLFCRDSTMCDALDMMVLETAKLKRNRVYSL